MLDYIYHMMFKSFCICIFFNEKTARSCQLYVAFL